MKRSESQSLYNALPGAYITYTCNAKDSKKNKQADKTVLKIKYWNTKDIEIDDIYYPKIVSQILPDIFNFKSDTNSHVEVDGTLNNLKTNRKQVNFLEIKKYKDENIIQIVGHIDPKLFYCPKCGKIKFLITDNDISKMICTNESCENKGRRLFQYNRIWVCSCGSSYPIDSYNLDPMKYRYFADIKDGFVNEKGEPKRIEKICSCGNKCTLENATDPKAFYPRIITSVKLTDDNEASLCETDEGKKLIVERQIGKITEEEFKYRAHLIKQKGIIKPDDTSDVFNSLLNNINKGDGQNTNSIETNYEEEVVYKILEYNTLKTKLVTSLDKAIENAIKCERINTKDEIKKLLKSLKISNIFSVSNIEIINTAYGYTRKYQSPEDLSKPNEPLKLCAFKSINNPGIASFYNIRTMTEGIIIDIDKRAIYNYLKDMYKESYNFNFPELSDEQLISWFIDKNKINCSLIKKFQDIDEENGKMVNLFTKCVYTLLHTISHMFINTISKFCGIDKSSLSEMIFLNACSILIYSQTNQGAVLGAITQSFDKYLYEILKDTYNDNKICTFDPLCMNSSIGSCCACTFLDEVACEHFNKDLSRRLLYGYENEKEKIINFWEEI